MRDLISSMIRLPMAMAQMGAVQLQQMLQLGSLSGGSSDRARSWDNFASDPVSTGVRTMLDAGQQMLRGMTENALGNEDTAAVGLVEPTAARDSFRAPSSSSSNRFTPGASPAGLARPAVRARPGDLGRLDITTIVVLGESLAAGLGDFSLSADFQRMSFPAQLADHLGAAVKQPLFEAPGIGFAIPSRSSVRIPDLKQTTVFEEYPAVPCGNLSIPGLSIRDCLHLRPSLPLVHQDDTKQTLANLILDPQALIQHGRKSTCRTPLECAIGRCPTTAIVALGFNDVLEPALRGQPEQLRPVIEQGKDFAAIVKALADTEAEVLVLTVPNPLDTACFSSLEAAARVIKMSPAAIRRLYELEEGDYLTVAGLLEIGAQINRGSVAGLKPLHVLPAQAARKITSYTQSLNEMIREVVDAHDRACLCDISEYLRELAQDGALVGVRQFTADYLGGFFTLNGFTPGHTGHALIANQIIRTLNGHFGASIPFLHLESVAAADPVATYRSASGVHWPDAELERFPVARSKEEPRRQLGRSAGQVLSGEDLDRQYNAVYRDPPVKPLELPPGLEQVLPLNRDASYHGDAMRVINCLRAEDVQWGVCATNVFDGLAMFGSHVEGSLRFRFSPPVNNISHFEVSIEGELSGEDGVLASPDFLRFPLKTPRVVQPPGTVCSGNVNLATGDVSNLDFLLVFENSGLAALQQLNRQSFPSPAIIRFKQNVKPNEGYGTAWARFQQRGDGRLDFLFHGTAFVPMGPGFRFALPLGSPDGDFATVPANGTQLHPHLHLSTVEAHQRAARASCEPMIPTNCIREFTADSSRTCFGDDFNLNHPELGFARGRSYLAGRILIQFGERFGDSVPFTVSMMPPGGLTRKRGLSPLQDVFPGRLVPGMEGHDTVLRFPLRTYRQNDLFLVDDPFDFAIGAVNIYSGEVIGDFLHRALLGQALFYALVRVEPRTPQGSFEYRGPSLFERGADGQLRYRFNGTVYLLYQEGFLFPLPDLTNGIAIGSDSQLDPYFQIEAVYETRRRPARQSGGERMQISTSGDRFSYQYSVSSHARDSSTFEYTNHSQNGQFRMHSLAWVDFMCSRQGGGRYDIVTFSGFGDWSLDKKKLPHIASVQVSTARDRRYVSILIDGGTVSNVNTSPPHEVPPLTALEERPAHERRH